MRGINSDAVCTDSVLLSAQHHILYIVISSMPEIIDGNADSRVICHISGLYCTVKIYRKNRRDINEYIL
jgi:hypothetical protein